MRAPVYWALASIVAVTASTYIVVELPPFLRGRDAARAAQQQEAAASKVWVDYKGQPALRLTTARLACREAAKGSLNDPAPIFTDIEDWPAKEGPPDHFQVDLQVRARAVYPSGYMLLSGHCSAVRNSITNGWQMDVQFPAPQP